MYANRFAPLFLVCDAKEVILACRMSENLKAVEWSRQFLRKAEDLCDLVVSNTVLAGEIAAPTGDEGARAEFVAQRLGESGFVECTTDEMANVVALLKGSEGRRAIVVATNLDTILDDPAHQTVEVRERHMIGPFVVDNSIAIGALLALPLLLEQCDMKLRSDVWLIFAAQCHRQANLRGLKQGLALLGPPPHCGVWVESVQLGRLNYSCLGVRRGEIVCRLPDDYNWAQYGAVGSIVPMSDIIQRIAQIPLPRRPLTSLVLGRIQGGVHHQNIARETELGFELRGERADVLAEIEQQIQSIVTDVSARYGVHVALNIFARREPGVIPIDHALVKAGRASLRCLGIEPMMYPTTSPMSAMLEAGLPAVTVGITTGVRKPDLDEWDETADLDALPKGMAHLATLLAITDEEFPS